ncbi:osmosensitive K+ channel histidine kinase KdpD [Cutibacterium acnes JCM 18916]|nr:osmosensitive K+ channel histidine kinase KdpD [Cutibacterium acnes JCM 18916]
MGHFRRSLRLWPRVLRWTIFFTKPFYTVTVNEPLHLVALLLYLLTAAW